MSFVSRNTTIGPWKISLQPRSCTDFHQDMLMPGKSLEALADKMMQAGAAGKGINIDQVQDSHEFYPGPSSRLPNSDSM